MMTRSWPVWALLLGVLSTPSAIGQQIRYYEQDGVTYRETRQLAQQPVTSAGAAVTTLPATPNLAPGATTLSPGTTAVIPAPRRPFARLFQRWRAPRAESISPPLQPGEIYRSITVPVVEYRWEPRVKGRWNPFATPRVEQRLVKRQRWENHIQRIPMPGAPPAMTATQLAQGVSQPAQYPPREVVTRVAVATRDAKGRPVPIQPGSGRTAALPREPERLAHVGAPIRPLNSVPPVRSLAGDRLIHIDHTVLMGQTVQQAAAIQPAPFDGAWRPSSEPSRR